jgi:predicted alpha/beta-hydrolase family hydrolase
VEAGEFRIAIDGGDVTGIAYPAADTHAAMLLAHGAGAGQRHAYMIGTAERLAARGVSVVTFDFAYTERGNKLPDPNDALEACLRAAFDATRARTDARLFVGGKSMGGRIASQCAANGTIDPKGLVFLGYPLHPPKKPEQRRDKHLPKVRAPMLFVQGSRDVFGTSEEVAPLVATLTATAPGTRFFAIDRADHSHAVPKRAGVPQEKVYATIADVIVEWMRELA